MPRIRCKVLKVVRQEVASHLPIAKATPRRL
ncbi:hypothetical protein Zm00014a_039762 [Zea mays]|uniref:Uncharacterized protein n=1 Tax=Zea mays TaxID=4577 RepID=A0A3L6DUA9_MAIZE|nr:hypothetical protein Zm00014a_039762 [Zea mays]